MNGILNRWQAKGLTTVGGGGGLRPLPPPRLRQTPARRRPCPWTGAAGVVSREDVDRMFQELQPAGGDPRKEG